MPKNGITQEQRWQIARALKAGKTHAQIARKLKLGMATINRWSRRLVEAGLIESKYRDRLERGAVMEAKIRRMLLEGKSGRWIRMHVPGAGNIDNVKRRMVACGELQPGARPVKLSSDQEKQIRCLLEQGRSIYHIQQIVRCDWRAIRKRAVKLGYKIGKRGPIPRRRTVVPDLVVAIETMMPLNCPQWIRDEAKNELWLELQGQKRPLEGLAKRATKIISEIYNRYDCFNPRRFTSIDEQRGEGRLSLAEVLPCPRAKQIIEAAGA